MYDSSDISGSQPRSFFIATALPPKSRVAVALSPPSEYAAAAAAATVRVAVNPPMFHVEPSFVDPKLSARMSHGPRRESTVNAASLAQLKVRTGSAGPPTVWLRTAWLSVPSDHEPRAEKATNFDAFDLAGADHADLDLELAWNRV